MFNSGWRAWRELLVRIVRQKLWLCAGGLPAEHPVERRPSAG
jgi:hypothetical protein